MGPALPGRRLLLATAVVAAGAAALPASSAPGPVGSSAARSAVSPAAAATTGWRRTATAAIWRQLGDPSLPEPPVPTPTNRLSGWQPQPAGTTSTLDLDFGPYVITPGADLSRIDFTPAVANGYVTEVHTFVLDADGTKVAGDEVHTHHVHLLEFNPNNPQYFDWLTGTGEEMTGGSIGERAKAVPAYAHGLRYGTQVTQGKWLGVLSMVHNMTAQERTVYLRFRIRFVYGTHDEIATAKHWNFHALTPQITGGTFNVPRTGGRYTWPADLSRVPDTAQNHGTITSNPTPSRLVPGTGVVWTAPYSGTIVIIGGHLHAGGADAVVSNLGSRSHPCPQAWLRGFPGTTLLNSRVIGHHGIALTNDYQMGLSRYDWRAYLHKGDRIAVNGAYLAKSYSYPDAMVFAGLYIDRSATPPRGAGCAPFLAAHPHASWRQVIRTTINHPWSMYPDQPTCSHCDHHEARPEPGPQTDVVHMAGMQYLPGNGGTSGLPAGPPVVTRGDSLTFVNEDYPESLMRHTVTTCRVPCNGMHMTNYPWFDGRYDSGVLGWMFEDAYVSSTTTPTSTFDTSRLRPGYYTFFCRIHPFMRGSFYVAPAGARTRSDVLRWWHHL